MVESGHSRMATRRTAARREKGSDYLAKREQILVAGAKLFREKGYAATRLNDVAEHIGIDRATLYYYFSSKEDLFHEVIRDVIDTNLNACEAILALRLPPGDKLAQLVLVILESYERHYPHVYVYIQEDMSRISQKDEPWAVDVAVKTARIEQIFLAVIKEGMIDGSFHSDLSATLCVNAVFGMISWTHRWHTPGKRFTAEQLADTFTRIFLDGVSTLR